MVITSERSSEIASIEKEVENITVQENKDLLNRVQLRQVASYIGITEQSLSRMRARLAKNR